MQSWDLNTGPTDRRLNCEGNGKCRHRVSEGELQCREAFPEEAELGQLGKMGNTWRCREERKGIDPQRTDGELARHSPEGLMGVFCRELSFDVMQMRGNTQTSELFKDPFGH